MEYDKMFDLHQQMNADVTVAVRPVTMADARRFGILKKDEDLAITDFVEKPIDPEVLKHFISRDDPARPLLGSMGIYIFNTDVLIEMLAHTEFDDFGGHVLPSSIKTHKVIGYDFDGYWEDIGTIRSFYDTNLALCMPDSPFNFIDQDFPIYSHPRFLPGSTIEDSSMEHVLLSEGCCIVQAQIYHSIVGLRSQIGSGVVIRDSILMGNDYYETPCQDDSAGPISLGIGSGCVIEGAIIDKNARIGRGTVIKPFPRGMDIDGVGWVVRDGIVVIPKDTTIRPGTRIVPD
jgi:glucose-1-phosphate adenylyltransferase